MEIYDTIADIPEFECGDCGSSNTFTSPIPVTAGGQVVAWAPGSRVCWDCWERVTG